MPRGVLTEETIKARRMKKLADIANMAAELGLESETIGESPAIVTPEVLEQKFKKTNGGEPQEDITLEVEATLLYFSLKGKEFEKAVCPICERVFAYKYYIPGQHFKCSNQCRKIALAAIGIEWNPYKHPEDRWLPLQNKGVIPLIVPPAALEIVEQRLQEIAEDHTTSAGT